MNKTNVIKLLLLTAATSVSLPTLAGYFYCPQKMNCYVDYDAVKHKTYTQCDNTPSGWEPSLSSWTAGVPLPATVSFYFISAQYFPTSGDQSNCNYYQTADNGGFYNVVMANYTTSAATSAGVWQEGIMKGPNLPMYYCYSSYSNSPTTPNDPSQCPFNL